MEIKVEDMDGMSQAELEALDDKMVAEEAEESESEPEAQTPPVDSVKDDTKGGDSEPGEPVKTESEDDPPETPPEGDKGGGEEDDEITNHISPPSKWAAQRQKQRELKEAADKAESTQEELDVTKVKLGELESQIDWLKSQAAGKGIDIEKMPLDALSPERIAEVREEYGDEMADMFQAVRTLQGGQAVEKEVEKPPATDQPPAPPKKEEPDHDKVNVAMDAAIENNDDLSYWQQESPKLWERAIATNDAFLQDPEYAKLSFADRFARVVEQVKTDVIKEAKEKVPASSDDGKKTPPESLSGTGSAPTIVNKDLVERILAASPDEQAKIYNGLPESERDEVDKVLGI